MRMTTGMSLMMAAVLGTGMLVAQTQATAPQTTAGQAAGAASTAGSNVADATTGAASGAMAQAGFPSDRQFVKKAIMGNNAEIDTAKMALQKSQNQAVKDYAQKMIDDHTKMLDSLHTVAQSENIKFEDKPSPMGAKLAAKLQTLDGVAFDKGCIDGMVTDHEGDVKDFSTEINHGQEAGCESCGVAVVADHQGSSADGGRAAEAGWLGYAK